MADPIINQAPKPLDYKQKEVVKEDGIREQQAIENTKPKGSVVNTVTVEEVKEIADEKSHEAKIKDDFPKRYFVNNIKAIDEKILDKLECGDMVVKITHQSSRKMHHCYIVSYYEHKYGCCLTYTAAGYIETQSYDYVDGHWVYNSQDLWQAE